MTKRAYWAHVANAIGVPGRSQWLIGASGLSKAIACNSTGAMSTWTSWSYRISLYRLGADDQDERLLVISSDKTGSTI